MEGGGWLQGQVGGRPVWSEECGLATAANTKLQRRELGSGPLLFNLVT